MLRALKDIGISVFLVSSMAVFLFPLFEPAISFAVEDQFTVTQTITSEIAFLTPASDVVMSGSIGGITGGTSNGQTQVVVLTNNSTGFTMTIKASSSPAMQGNVYGGTITDYTPAATAIPDYTWTVPSGYEFGYSVSASNTPDNALKFMDNTSACNVGSADTSKGGDNACWYNLSTVATSTIVRSTNTPASGATSTVFFRLTVTPNSGPISDVYVATTTLTATAN
jgi:hypothetical protein